MAFTVHHGLALATVAEDTDWPAILRAGSLAQHVIHEISPRAVLIEPEAVDRLVTWLQKNGQLPKVVQG
jgi:hypothetical protein